MSIQHENVFLDTTVKSSGSAPEQHLSPRKSPVQTRPLSREARKARERRLTRLPWQVVPRWFQENTFAPTELPKGLHHPAIGYLVAVLLQVLALIATMLLRQVFPTFAFISLLAIFAIVLVAVRWGAGPSLVGTVIGATLLNFVALQPHFSWDLDDPEDFVGIFLFLVVGLTISIAASQAERMRRNAKELTTSLAKERAQLDEFIETVPDVVSIHDAEGKMVRLNRAGRQNAGPYHGSESLIEALNAYELRTLTGESFSIDELPVSRALRGETVSAVEMYYRDVEGQERCISVSAAPLHDLEGKVEGAITITHDISILRQSEQRTHATLNALLTMAEALVSTPDDATPKEELTFPAANKVARRLAETTCSVLGCQRVAITTVEPETKLLQPIAVVGLSLEQESEWWASQPQDAHLGDNLDPALVARLHANKELLLDMRQPPFSDLPNPYGACVVLIVPMYVGDQLVGFLSLDYGGMEHDYTSQEIALARAVAKLAALVIERERLLHERAQAQANEVTLRETNQRMNEFLSMTSHELKTPLTSITGNTQLAMRQLRGSLQALEKMQGQVESTERQIKRLNRLVDDLLDISRPEAEHPELNLAPCDLAAIVRGIVEEQRRAWPSRSINLDLTDGTTAPMHADADRIAQVVTNYLTNALKYSDEDRPVQVSLRLEGEEACVSVQDEGPGLSPDEQEHIWERFHRVHGVEARNSSFGSSGGLGLGLYISKTIIEQHGGRVGVESAPDQGSTFWFTLPLAHNAL